MDFKNVDVEKIYKDAGFPMTVIHFDEDGAITRKEEYNHENFQIQDWQAEAIARVIYPAIQEFFNDPKHMKEYEEWKQKQEPRVTKIRSKRKRR